MELISISVSLVGIAVAIWSVWQQRRDNNANIARFEVLQNDKTAQIEALQKEVEFLRQQNTSLLAQNKRLTELVQYLAQQRGDH